jgi:hypothetical protein
MGDAEFQAALIHDFNERWAAGFGAKLIAPTGTDDLASGKWHGMPGASFRVMLPEIGPTATLFRWCAMTSVSPATLRGAKSGNLQLAPTLNLGPSQSLVFHVIFLIPIFRWNFGDPVPGQTGACFFRLMRCGSSAQKWLGRIPRRQRAEIIKDYPVYDFKVEARVHFSY